MNENMRIWEIVVTPLLYHYSPFVLSPSLNWNFYSYCLQSSNIFLLPGINKTLSFWFLNMSVGLYTFLLWSIQQELHILLITETVPNQHIQWDFAFTFSLLFIFRWTVTQCTVTLTFVSILLFLYPLLYMRNSNETFRKFSTLSFKRLSRKTYTSRQTRKT